MRLELDYMTLDDSGLLGPAPRIVLWLHGCGRDCPGCIATDWNKKDGSTFSLSVGTLLRYIDSHQDLEGVTISGGEPFIQDAALGELVSALHSKGLGIIIYTGYVLAELQSNPQAGVQKALFGCDTLIDGPYDETMDDDQSLRGSSNQKIYHFTSRYREYFSTSGARRSVILEENGQRYILGIPDVDAKERWAEIKRGAGIAPEREEG